MISSASVKDVLQEFKISKVAIIDDVFDPPWQMLSLADKQTLFDEFGSRSGVISTFKDANVLFQEPNDLNEQALALIQDASTRDGEVAEFSQSILGLVELKKQNLLALVDRLSAGFKLDVTCLGAIQATQNQPTIVPADCNVVFLDYDLQTDAPTKGKLSSELCAKIYEQFRSAEAVPLVILISTNQFNDADIAAFRDGTKLLSGMFYFVSKSELADEEQLNYRLVAFAKSLPTGQVLQRFVSVLESGMKDAAEKVFQTIRSLSISDYAYLEMMHLADDGQPLGEYLMWLFGAQIAKEISEGLDVKDLERKVNSLGFEHLPPAQSRPTPHLATLYSSAVIKAADPLPDSHESNDPYLQFGDLFRKENNSPKIWLCITAPCDLAYSLTNPSGRPFRKGRSILFLPGTLHPIEKPMTSFQSRQPRTELVRLGNAQFRIIWDPKEVSQCEFGKLAEWQTSKKVKRVARLHTAFALEVQRSFAADMTRIGMPTPPPFYVPRLVKLTCLGSHGEAVELTTDESRGVLMSGGGIVEKCILGEEFMDLLPVMLNKAKTSLEGYGTSIAADESQGEELKAKVVAALKKFEELHSDTEFLVGFRGPFEVPPLGRPIGLLNSSVVVCHDADVAKLVDFAEYPLRLHILPPEGETPLENGEAV